MTETQIAKVWQDLMSADARSTYFADIASRQSALRRRLISGALVLSFANLAALLSDLPLWVPLILALALAMCNGYRLAVSLDSQIRTAEKLHIGWSRLTHQYEKLYANIYAEDADQILDRIQKQAQDLSVMAATEMTHDQKLFDKWVNITYAKYATAEPATEG